MISLVSVAMEETDKRALTAGLIILIVLLLVIGLLGIALRALMNYQGRRVDKYMGDVVSSGLLDTPAKFRRLSYKKSNRLFFKQSSGAFLIALVSGIALIVYMSITDKWGMNVFDESGDLFFRWNFDDEASYATFWGLKLLASWPPLSNSPHFELEHLASYILAPLFLAAMIWYFLASLSYLSRALRTSRLCDKLYVEDLEKTSMPEMVRKGEVPPAKPTDTK